MRSPENKLYVNIKTGVVYHKPATVNGLKYEPSKDLYEITPEQSARLAKGESLREVLRAGIRDRVEAELEQTIPSAPEVPSPEVPSPEVPATDSADFSEADVEAFTQHKELDSYAGLKGLVFPADCTTVQKKKDFIKTALLRG